MELTLKRLLEQAEFNEVRRGGYDKDEVNSLLDRAVAMAAKVEVKLAETLEAERGGGGRSDEEIEAEIERRVAAARPARTGPTEQEQAEEVARALLLAQRSADAAIEEAEQKAAAIRSRAEADIGAMRAEAASELEAERARARERIRDEIAALERVRESLRSDVDVLERHVEEQRTQLRGAIGQLERLLDDPSGLRVAPTPDLADDEAPTGDDRPLIAAPAPASTEPAVDRDVPAADGPPEPETPAVPVAPEVDRDEAPAAGASLDFGGVEHDPPVRDSVGETTAAVPVAEGSDDLFMAELRRAIEDEEPLGPRDPEPSAETPNPFEPERRGWRFGRR